MKGKEGHKDLKKTPSRQAVEGIYDLVRSNALPRGRFCGNSAAIAGQQDLLSFPSVDLLQKRGPPNLKILKCNDSTSASRLLIKQIGFPHVDFFQHPHKTLAVRQQLHFCTSATDRLNLGFRHRSGRESLLHVLTSI